MVRIGIVGYGYWGPNLVRDFHEVDGATVAACADLSEERLGAIRKRYPGIRTTRNVSDIINDGSIDAVVIATPAHTHYGLAKESLKAGKHTLVEKPLTFVPEEAQELVELSEKTGKVLMVGHTFEFNPAV